MALACTGCHPRSDIHIGYYPFKVISSTNEYSAPGRGPVVASLKPGEGFGGQSTINLVGSATPPLRRASNGFIWGYNTTTSASGWVSQSALIPFPTATHIIGPARRGFQVGNGLPPHKKIQSFHVHRLRRNYVVKGRHWVYLRAAPGGDPLYKLAPKDHLRGLAGEGAYVFVVVRNSQGAPKAMRGWVSVAHLHPSH